MDEQLVELKKLVALIEAQAVTPEKSPTRDDFLLAAELVSTAGKMLAAEANVEGGAALRPRRPILGHILMAIAIWLLSEK
jgi:hypothetical protein